MENVWKQDSPVSFWKKKQGKKQQREMERSDSYETNSQIVSHGTSLHALNYGLRSKAGGHPTESADA
ncbi:hypothetical protein BBR01nite_21470 [Brevibacillus brevis]|nr:hypothetical protein BBR01nite_21470 [Brevibacillus brevis]